jgi:hypothetical protein
MIADLDRTVARSARAVSIPGGRASRPVLHNPARKPGLFSQFPLALTKSS